MEHDLFIVLVLGELRPQLKQMTAISSDRIEILRKVMLHICQEDNFVFSEFALRPAQLFIVLLISSHNFQVLLVFKERTTHSCIAL